MYTNISARILFSRKYNFTSGGLNIIKKEVKELCYFSQPSKREVLFSYKHIFDACPSYVKARTTVVCDSQLILGAWNTQLAK